jgi:hypothetical protein
MNKQKYIIVGSNNFWYTTTEPVDSKGLEKEIRYVKEGIERGDYEHGEKPEKLFAMVVTGEEETFEL